MTFDAICSVEAHRGRALPLREGYKTTKSLYRAIEVRCKGGIAFDQLREGQDGQVRRVTIALETGALPGAFPQPLYIPQGWCAKEALVLAVEVGGILVAHAVAGASSVKPLDDHEPAGLLQT